jgi:hypothetical protein
MAGNGVIDPGDGWPGAGINGLIRAGGKWDRECSRPSDGSVIHSRAEGLRLHFIEGHSKGQAMHQIVLFTALSATTGIFGGGRATCTTGTCGQVYAAPAPAVAAAAPNVTYYTPAPAPQVVQPQFAAPRLARRNRVAFYTAPATCTTGTCPRR